jgi:hypothetical protein
MLKETFCYGDVLLRRRFVTETFCYGEVLLRRRSVMETFCMESFFRGDVLYVRLKKQGRK